MKLTIEEQLFHPEYACGFDPFEAALLLELLVNTTPNSTWKDAEQVLRFRANVTMGFPPSLLAQVIPPQGYPVIPKDELGHAAAQIRNRYQVLDVPILVLNFFGLFGPQGALPLHYTRTLCELDGSREFRRLSTRTALRDWLDMFNNRMSALLYRAWQKYRLPVGYRRASARKKYDPNVDPHFTDKFTHALFCTVGLGVPGLRDCLRVEEAHAEYGTPPLLKIDDQALLHYAGAFTRRFPGQHELEAILADYFSVSVGVKTLTGQWLLLPPESQTRLSDGSNAELGVNAVAGEQIWDVNSKFRIRLGPLRYNEFINFLPDPTPIPQRKGVYLLSQLTRLYVGPEFDFEVQLVLYKFEVPDCVLQDVDEGQLGIRLGWNTWLTSDDMPDEVDDVMFDAPCDVRLPAML